MLNIDLRNGSGESIKDKWKNGTMTHLGLSVPGFPNMFYTYGPHAPTAFANDPTCAEAQGEWLTRLFLKLREKGTERIEAKEESRVEWRKKVHEIWEGTCCFHKRRVGIKGRIFQERGLSPLIMLEAFQSILRN